MLMMICMEVNQPEINFQRLLTLHTSLQINRRRRGILTYIVHDRRYNIRIMNKRLTRKFFPVSIVECVFHTRLRATDFDWIRFHRFNGSMSPSPRSQKPPSLALQSMRRVTVVFNITMESMYNVHVIYRLLFFLSWLFQHPSIHSTAHSAVHSVPLHRVAAHC